MIKLNKVGISIIGLFILITSCESDALELDPSGGQSLLRTVFTLSSDSKALQDSVLIGSSRTLYAGYVEDKLSTILVSLDYNNIQEHPICIYLDEPDSLKDIQNIKFIFNSLQPLMDSDSNLFVDTTSLMIGLSSIEIWDEESDINSSEFSQKEWDIETVIDSINFSENSLQITILNPLQLTDWCSSQNQYLIIKYEPEILELSDEKLDLLEFYSSESSISNRPEVIFDYSRLTLLEKSTNKFIIDSINSQLSESTAHVINNTESESWSRVYLLNVDDVLEANLDSSIVTYDLSYNDTPIISSEMLNQEIELLKLNINFNDEIIDDIDTFNLSILPNSIIAHSNSSDLSGDNFDVDTLGTENNLLFDQGEDFLDFGTDQCPDQFEAGDGFSCLVEIDDFDSTELNCIASDDSEPDSNCIYNSYGTEDNGSLDWEDLAEAGVDLNGIWDEGEGEKWEDIGSDGCADEYETGDGTCLENLNVDYVEGSDPNDDNYNIDPAGDNYDEIENPNGTENNGIWEEGEPFFDIGCDGIPQIIDELQNNGVYDDCEPFNDTGIDGIYTGSDEPDYQNVFSYNPTGTEGDSSYQLGETFYDFGVDNIQEGSAGDDPFDNYNIDPNGDNDLGDGNQTYDEGEYFYDYGIDGLSDADEMFSQVNLLNIGVGTNQGLNDYIIDQNMIESASYLMPDISNYDAVIWISNIKPTVEENEFELTFSTLANKEIKSLSFSLTHGKLDWVDTTFVEQSFQSNNYSTKFIDDMSVYGINALEDETQLRLNYGYGITSKIDFINIDSSRVPVELSLNDFIDDKGNVLLSNTYTQLVLPVDVQSSIIGDSGANLVLSGIINNELEIARLTWPFSKDDERLFIPMHWFLQRYLNGEYINYNGFELELELDGSQYDFANIILNDSIYLEIIYSE